MSIKKMLKLLAILFITLLFAWYIKNNFHKLKEALKIKPSYLFYIILLNMLNKAFVGYKTKKLVESFKIRLSWTEWFGASVVNNFYNYFAPKSGTALVGVYLKKKYSLNYEKYLGSLITSGLITILTSGACGLLATIGSYIFYGAGNKILILIFLGMIILPLAVFLMPENTFPDRWLFAKINKFHNGWAAFSKNPRLLAVLSLFDAGIVLVLALRYYVIFRILSMNIRLAECVLISPFNIIFHFATVIPGGYGIKEAAVGLVSKLTNIGFTAGVLATLGDRAVVMALSFITGPIFSFVLFKKGFLTKEEQVDA
jgi:uncharacterized membrane protein YbhN (UPF0104 family)